MSLIDEIETLHAKLKQAEECFYIAFHNSAIGMAITDKSFKFLEVNRRLSHILNIPKDELVTKDYLYLTHPDDRQWDLLLGEEVKTGNLATYELHKRFVRLDGVSVWCIISVSVLPNDTLLHHIQETEVVMSALENNLKKQKEGA